MKLNKSSLLVIIPIILLIQSSFSQTKDTLTNKSDTLGSKSIVKPKAFEEFISKDAKVDSGLLTIYYQKEKYYLEIKDSLLCKDLLLVSRISRGGADARGEGNLIGFAGDEINNAVIRFEKGPSDKIFIRQCSFTEYSKDSTKEMYRSVMSANLLPIVASFPVVAFSKNNDGNIFDITSFFNGDNSLLYFSAAMKTALKLGAFQPDRSYISAISSYPINTEIKTVKTYERVSAAGLLATLFPERGSSAITIEVNVSFVLLPEIPMKPRYNDDRVGYFNISYSDFDMNPYGVKNMSIIKKWNLQPHKKDIPRYFKGELVEPEKPIVFYIDPATPSKWVPYLIKGINDWQAAFEQAGFKNAIIGKPAPTKEEDSTWSIDDARHSVIVYKPSIVANASGPSIADPRTGQILESHINWYHNVMTLLTNWYMVQASPSDPRARTTKFTDSLVGQLIRFAASHEVGHALGLMHNFGSSSTVPVDSLRNKKWVEKNGHTPSIMDYARFNYVAQPEDSIGEAGLFPRIGDYDRWAIEFGYRLFPDTLSQTQDRAKVNKWIINKLKNKRLWFGSEFMTTDPRCQSEGLGDDAMKAGIYGIANLKFILLNLTTWMTMPNEDYSEIATAYAQVISQYKNYLKQVAVNIGGKYVTFKMADQPGNVYEVVPKEIQKKALEFLDHQLFTEPEWLIKKEVVNKISMDIPSVISGIQTAYLDQLMSTDRLYSMLRDQVLNPGVGYSINDYLEDLRKTVYRELSQGRAINAFKRNLQKAYLANLFTLAGFNNSTPPPVAMPDGLIMVSMKNDLASMSDISSIAKYQIQKIRSDLRNKLSSFSDLDSKQHIMDLLERIDIVLRKN